MNIAESVRETGNSGVVHQLLICSGRQSRRTQKYPDDEYVREVDGEVSSDEEIIGEVIFDEEYLKRKRKKREVSSERDEEYRAEEDDFEGEDDQEANVDSDYVNSEDDSSGSRLGSRPKRGRSEGVSNHWGLRRSSRATRATGGHGQYDSEYEDADRSNGEHRYRVGREAVNKEEDCRADESEDSQEQSVGHLEGEDEDEDSGSRDYGGGDMDTVVHSNGLYSHDDFAPDHLRNRSGLLDLNEAVSNGHNTDEVPASGSTKLRLRLGVHRPARTDIKRSDGNQSDRVGGLENGASLHAP